MNCQTRREILTGLHSALFAFFGPLHWWPAETSFEMCIGALLTQNAPWTGVQKSIGNLRAAGIMSADALAVAPLEQVSWAIRPSIYHNQKAKRLRHFCRFLLDRCEGDIRSLKNRPLEDVRTLLLGITGFGRETADSIILYALEKPVFVVDAYTRRILSRHRLIDPESDYDEIRSFFEDGLDKDAALFNEFHAELCRLGADICRKKPLCSLCPVRTLLGEPQL